MVSPRQKRRNRAGKQGKRPTSRQHLENARIPPKKSPKKGKKSLDDCTTWQDVLANTK